jgi:hypothetical protein
MGTAWQGWVCVNLARVGVHAFKGRQQVSKQVCCEQLHTLALVIVLLFGPVPGWAICQCSPEEESS